METEQNGVSEQSATVGRPPECPKECPAGSSPDAVRPLCPYRVFISYSHEDVKTAEALERHLRGLGLFTVTDRRIRVGSAFSEEIQEMIECAHVFMPLVTTSANQRLWVQQEIGYATALHVPLCPIIVGIEPPKGMAEQIQGIHFANGLNPEETGVSLRDRLDYRMFDSLVRGARGHLRQGRFECAMEWSERQRLLASLTKAARDENCAFLGTRQAGKTLDLGTWRLRQRAAFGSFSIPDIGADSPAWDARDPNRYGSHRERRLLRAERQAMESYANCFGCDLILSPEVSLQKKEDGRASGSARGKSAGGGEPDEDKARNGYLRTAFRAALLAGFIRKHLDNDRVRVAMVDKSSALLTNQIIVGNWFASEAVVPYGGATYDRTMFTRHAPTVLDMIDRFDQDFADLSGGGQPAESKSRALTEGKNGALEALGKCHEESREHLDEARKKVLREALSQVGLPAADPA